MIEMNLTNSPAYIVGNYPNSHEKKAMGIFLIIAIFVVVPLASFLGVKAYFEIAAEKEIQTAVQAEQNAADIAMKSRPADDRIVEEIIDSVSGTLEVAVEDKKYENMAKFEQLDYEVKFSALVMSEFIKNIPGGISFNTIKISDYKNLIAEGTAPDKRTVSALLAKFKKGGWELLPLPKTKITDGGSFYYFRVEAQFIPPVEKLLSRPINPENIPYIEHLNSVKVKITAAAKNLGVSASGLTLKNSVNEPHKKEYTYEIKLSGGFASISTFLQTISQISEPVRVKSIELKSRSKTIDATAVIIIGVR